MEELLGHKWIGIDPRPSANRVLSSLHESFPYYEANYSHWLPSDKSSSILDYGCGAGALLQFLESFGYRNISGYEPDTRFASFLRQNSSIPIDSTSDPRTYLAGHKGRFDLVIVRQVVYYFPRNGLQQWMNELADLLKPGGRILIEVVNGAMWTGSWVYHKDPYVQTVFTEPLIRALISTANLQLSFLGVEKERVTSFKKLLWTLARRGWFRILSLVFLLERGNDPSNPSLFGKFLIAVADKPSPDIP